MHIRSWVVLMKIVLLYLIGLQQVVGQAGQNDASFLFEEFQKLDPIQIEEEIPEKANNSTADPSILSARPIKNSTRLISSMNGENWKSIDGSNSFIQRHWVDFYACQTHVDL